MITTIDNFDAHTFLMAIEYDNFRELFHKTLTEYVRMLKRTVYDYKKYSLVSTGRKSLARVAILYGNHRVGTIAVAPNKGSHTTRLRYTAEYDDVELDSFDCSKIARVMVGLRPPTLNTEAANMRALVISTLGQAKDLKAKEATAACSKAENKISSEMHFYDIESPLMQRVVSLVSSTDSPKYLFREWIDSGAIALTQEYYVMQETYRRVASGYFHCKNDAYIRHWSDGSGIMVTGNERYELDNVMEQMPIELSEKLAVLKVSGLNYIADVGVRTEPVKIHDTLEESIYFLLRD